MEKKEEIKNEVTTSSEAILTSEKEKTVAQETQMFAANEYLKGAKEIAEAAGKVAEEFVKDNKSRREFEKQETDTFSDEREKIRNNNNLNSEEKKEHVKMVIDVEKKKYSVDKGIQVALAILRIVASTFIAYKYIKCKYDYKTTALKQQTPNKAA